MSNSVKKMPVRPAESSELPTNDLWRPFDRLRHQVDRLFEDFSRGRGLLPLSHSPFESDPFLGGHWLGARQPAVEISERPKSYEITVELPGMDEKDIEIKLRDQQLSIKGEKTAEKDEQHKGYHLSERHYGRFKRLFSLPLGVDTNNVQAHFSKGLLSISLPKKPRRSNRKNHSYPEKLSLRPSRQLSREGCPHDINE